MRHFFVYAALLTASRPIVAQPVPAADTAFFQGRWQDAMRLYTAALAKAPGNRSVLVKAGFSALELGRADTAETLFRSALTLPASTGAPAARAGLAFALLRRGARDEALGGLEVAVKEGYANVDQLDAAAKAHGLANESRFVTLRERAVVNGFPCMGDSAARSFDFWIGAWDVYVTGTAIRAGTNRIERVAGGCALLENWTAWLTPMSPPNEGQSLNFIDPATGTWRQVWMGSGRGQNNFSDGVYRDGAMRFAFERTDPQGNRLIGRFTFFNLGPDRVRQLQEISRDDGATWNTVYDFTYERRTG